MRRKKQILFAATCAICVVVILLCAGSIDSSIRYQRMHMLAVPIAIDNFLKQIGLTLNISELAHNETFAANDRLIPFWQLTNKTLDLKSLKERLQILPIKCSPGSEGLFPSKYEKLLLSLTEYATFHREVSDAPQLIWRCGHCQLIWICGHCGGLADRLRGITYTLLLAVFSRRRLLLHWGMPNGEDVYLKPNLIDWVTNESNTENAVYFQVMDSMSHANIPSAMEAIGSTLGKIAISANFELDAVNKQVSRPRWLIDGLNRTGLDVLTNKEINEIFGIAFRYLFQMGRDLSLIVNSAKDVLGLDIGKYVAVHIRTGFVGSGRPEAWSQGKFIGRKQWEKMLMCAVSMANSSVGSDSPIFLATDSKKVKDLAVRMYDSRYKTLNVTPTHLDKLPKYSGPNIPAMVGLLSTWVDFFLLAQSYVLVKAGNDWISGSGFGVAGSQLCGIPRDRRIDGRENCISEDKLSHS